MMKITITTSVAKARINAALRPYLHVLKTIRSRHHVIDYRRNLLSYHDVDLETFGQELGVIKPWETVDTSNSRALPISKTAKDQWRCSAMPRNTANRFGYGSQGKAYRGIDQYVIEDLRKLLQAVGDAFGAQ